MQKDFHYDIIFALAKEAGYKPVDANIIAFASQPRAILPECSV